MESIHINECVTTNEGFVTGSWPVTLMFAIHYPVHRPLVRGKQIPLWTYTVQETATRCCHPRKNVSCLLARIEDGLRPEGYDPIWFKYDKIRCLRPLARESPYVSMQGYGHEAFRDGRPVADLSIYLQVAMLPGWSLVGSRNPNANPTTFSKPWQLPVLRVSRTSRCVAIISFVIGHSWLLGLTASSVACHAARYQ